MRLVSSRRAGVAAALVALSTISAVHCQTTAAPAPAPDAGLACAITLAVAPDGATPACAPVAVTVNVTEPGGRPAAGEVTIFANGRAATGPLPLSSAGVVAATLADLTPEAYTIVASYRRGGAGRCNEGASAGVPHGVTRAEPRLGVAPVPANLTHPACAPGGAAFWVAAAGVPGCPPATGAVVGYLVPGPSSSAAARGALPGPAEFERLVTGAAGAVQGAPGTPAAPATGAPQSLPARAAAALASLSPRSFATIAQVAQAGFQAGRAAVVTGGGAAAPATVQPAAGGEAPVPAAPAPPSPAAPKPAVEVPLSAAAVQERASTGAVAPPRTVAGRRLAQAGDAPSDAAVRANAGLAADIATGVLTGVATRALANSSALTRAAVSAGARAAGSPAALAAGKTLSGVLMNASAISAARGGSGAPPAGTGAGAAFAGLAPPRLLGAAPLIPDSIMPGSTSRAGITPAPGATGPLPGVGAAAGGPHAVVVRYGGDRVYAPATAVVDFDVDARCLAS